MRHNRLAGNYEPRRKCWLLFAENMAGGLSTGSSELSIGMGTLPEGIQSTAGPCSYAVSMVRIGLTLTALSRNPVGPWPDV